MTEDRFHTTWVRQIGEMSNPFDYDLPMSSVFIKYSLIFWNLIMLICGFILTIVGFVAAAEYAQNSGIESLFNHKYISLPVFIGIVGLIVTLICFFGCYGSCKESSGLTIVYGLSLTVMMILLLISGIVGYVYRSQVDQYVKDMLDASMEHWCTSNPGPWTFAQTNFKCCGVNSYKEWKNNKDWKYYSRGYFELELKKNGTKIADFPVPDECCKEQSAGCGIAYKNIDHIHTDGCLKKIETTIEENLAWVAGAAIGISIFSLIIIVVSCCVAKNYKQKYDHMS